MGGNQQFTRLSSLAYADQGYTIGFSAPTGNQFLIGSISVYNAVASENAIGLYHSITNSQFKMAQITAGVGADVTTTIQAGTVTTVFSTTNNDGSVFQSKNKFNMVGFNISQAQTGSPVYTYAYWNGSTWATLPLLNTPVYTATGIQLITFNAPIDWAVSSGVIAGTDSSMYAIRVLATTAPGTAVRINGLRIAKMIKYQDAVLPNSYMTVDFEEEPYLLQSGEAIIPSFSYTNGSNRLELAYKYNP